MARTRTLKVTLTFSDDADAAKVDAAVEAITTELNERARDFTGEQVEKWGKWESLDIAFPKSAMVEHAVTLSERVERATLVHFGSPVG